RRPRHISQIATDPPSPPRDIWPCSIGEKQLLFLVCEVAPDPCPRRRQQFAHAMQSSQLVTQPPHLPHARRVVPACGNNKPSIWAKGNAAEPIRVPTKDEVLVVAVGTSRMDRRHPDMRDAVAGAGGDHSAVGTQDGILADAPVDPKLRDAFP